MSNQNYEFKYQSDFIYYIYYTIKLNNIVEMFIYYVLYVLYFII